MAWVSLVERLFRTGYDVASVGITLLNEPFLARQESVFGGGSVKIAFVRYLVMDFERLV